MHDLAWEALYRPIVRALDHASVKLNQLQFLTDSPLPGARLRTSCSCSWCLRYGADPGLTVQGAQMMLVLAMAPLLTGFVRKMKARLLRRRGPSVFQPYRDLLRLMRKEVVLADNASWLFRVIPYLVFAATWVAAALVPTFAVGLTFSWAADLIAIVALLGSARFSWRSREWTWAPASAGSARAARS